MEAAYFQEAAVAGSGEEIVEAPLALLIPTWSLVVVNFYFGINAAFTTEVAGSAARTLMGMAP